jgi:ribosomal protein S18 acetylase RimI-like enzyme
VNYRLYASADFGELYGIEETCFQPPLRFPRTYLRRLLENADSTAWIAEEDGRIAGFAVVEWRQYGDGLAGYIETIEVLPEMRGRGIGNELLRRIEESARENGAGAIWLHVESQNAGAIRLYESHGYVCEGRKENYYASGRASLIYRKALQAHT